MKEKITEKEVDEWMKKIEEEITRQVKKKKKNIHKTSKIKKRKENTWKKTDRKRKLMNEGKIEKEYKLQVKKESNESPEKKDTKEMEWKLWWL